MINFDVLLNVLGYEGPQTNDPADAEKINNRIQESTVTALTRQRIQIADATTDQVIAIPDPNSEYLFVLTDRDISIKLNGSATAVALKTRANGKKTFVFYTKGAITGLTLSNASGGIANVDILVANK
jgi:hypothetical protein